MKCPKCNGSGEVYWGSEPPHYIDENITCNRCKGSGKIKLNLGDRTKSIKYSHVIQPVRKMAMENSALRNTLRAMVRTLCKTRYKKNKQARLIVKQGKYIQCLKERIRQYEESTMPKV